MITWADQATGLAACDIESKLKNVSMTCYIITNYTWWTEKIQQGV